jgi:hypothetical protein
MSEENNKIKHKSISIEKCWAMEKRKSSLNKRNRRPNRTQGFISRSLSKEKLEDLYFVQNKSLQDIAKEYNCTKQMVKLLMEKYGLSRRKRSEARVLAIKEGKFEQFEYHDINENFFSEWSPQMAWVLGLLFTDGYIVEEGTGLRACSGLSVVLASIDRDMLENVRTHLKSTRPIRKKVQSYDKTKHIYSFDFYRKKMRDDLQKLGLIQRKSLTMKFPNVPEEYMRHFIRGCWDGDGSVYIGKNNKINASYVSGSKDFIERLAHELHKIGICRKKISQISKDLKEMKLKYGIGGSYPLAIHKQTRSNAYSIKLNSIGNCRIFFHYLYDGTDESSYLKRKYDVFMKGYIQSYKKVNFQRRQAVISNPRH